MRTLSPVRPFSLWLPTPDARLFDLLFLPYCCWCCRRRRRCVSYTFRTICQKAFSHSQRLHLINHINYNYPENLCAFLAESWRLTARRKCVLCFGFFVYFFLSSLLFCFSILCVEFVYVLNRSSTSAIRVRIKIQKRKIMYSSFILFSMASPLKAFINWKSCS